MYRKRRDALVGGLRGLGWEVNSPAATFYVWIKCPRGKSSTETAGALLDQCDIVMTPGNGFGKYGEGYIRAALTQKEERIVQAVERIKTLKM
jgi:aspartate/methionine/tyrosine aminotransferase